MMKVMISEDDFRVANLHEQFLNTIDDIEVVAKAANAEETIALVEEKQPDLLLLDVYMPDELGSHLLPRIRDKSPQTDVIMITAAKDKETVEHSLNYGVVDYIIKPITIERFQKTIEEYKKRTNILNKTEEFSQETLDFLLNQQEEHREEEVPKGIDPITLKKVERFLMSEKEGVTAEQVSEKMGASKTTARRYLEYLVSTDTAAAEMKYGRVGRPERKYYPY
ncbi:response regulator [Salimicrobium album]|uniref:Response regulator of citrate/malate metabolism n=2 Tax=Salimicrobium album TaxID=50717 RepID=A0A1H3EMX8_9BACI|nr:response regulator [Salimicrobium album]SDX79955.1 Response regulator of citrate/malate metabolism [Salimicrobium album]